jgi:CheY-like chemotaxis protein
MILKTISCLTSTLPVPLGKIPDNNPIMRNLPLTILCIDDDDDDTELFREAVSTVDSSCVCLTVSKAMDGLRILQNAIPDIIFLDINMPMVDGRETLRRIRAITELSNIPVYMLSTTMDEDELGSFRKVGATGCLSKPKTFMELCTMLHDVLGTLV